MSKNDVSPAADAAPSDDAGADAPPPVLGTWNRFYTVVVLNTVLIYILLVLFSAYAR